MPLPQASNNKAKLLSLQDSMRLQKEHEEEMRELRMKNALERLKSGRTTDANVAQSRPLANVTEYRNVEQIDSDPEQDEEVKEDEEEIEDEEEGADKGVGFVFSEYE